MFDSLKGKVTGNTEHFDRTDDLKINNWIREPLQAAILTHRIPHLHCLAYL